MASNRADRPRRDTKCVGCRRLATKYCDGWDHSGSPPGPYGHFTMSVQCGYPVCDNCVHMGNGEHAPKNDHLITNN